MKTENVWNAVEEALGLEGEGQKLFENTKKKYSKKRIQLKKAKRSGAGRDDIYTFQKSLDEYSFLAWLDPYMKMRDTKTNIIPQEIPYDDEEGYEQEHDRDGHRSKDGESEEAPEEEAPVKLRKRKYQGNREGKNEILTTFKVTGQVKWKKGSPSSVAAELLESINKRMTERSLMAEKKVGKDEDDIFGEMIAGELKCIQKKVKHRLKHQINNLIFKYQNLYAEP